MEVTDVMAWSQGQVGLQGERLESKWKKQRFSCMDLLGPAEFESPHQGAITGIDLDKESERFILACSTDSSISIYDSHGSLGVCRRDSIDCMRRVALLTKESHGNHQKAIHSICWYPIDAGMFITGGHDNTVKIWDSNVLEAVLSLNVDGAVFGTKMSALAHSHCLVATHGSMNDIVLCDVATGTATHRLIGHKKAVYACSWSASSEWELISGGADGQVRLWDVRRPGSRYIFDMHETMVTSDPRSSQSSYGMSGESARAHQGSVIGCSSTPGGLFWITTGNDGHARVWDVDSKRHLMRHFEKRFSKTKFPRGIAIADDGSTLFHPSGKEVVVMNLLDGSHVKTLRGHFNGVYTCIWNSSREELYSAGADKSIFVWEPKIPDNGEGDWSNDDSSDGGHYAW